MAEIPLEKADLQTRVGHMFSKVVGKKEAARKHITLKGWLEAKTWLLRLKDKQSTVVFKGPETLPQIETALEKACAEIGA